VDATGVRSRVPMPVGILDGEDRQAIVGG
jgi:hypothetical protein